MKAKTVVRWMSWSMVLLVLAGVSVPAQPIAAGSHPPTTADSDSDSDSADQVPGKSDSDFAGDSESDSESGSDSDSDGRPEVPRS